jgi:anthranilate synthase component 1
MPQDLPTPPGPVPSAFAERFEAAAARPVLLPVYRRLLSDSLTPVLAYRRLVRPDPRMAPSFLFESVIDGERVGRFSFLGSRPAAEILAYGNCVTLRDHANPEASREFESQDPLAEASKLTEELKLTDEAYADLPAGLTGAGGWVGYAGYDTVRYLEGESLPSPPPDDRGLPDLHLQLYFDTVIFDHAQKTLLLMTHLRADRYPDAESAYGSAAATLDTLTTRLLAPDPKDGVVLPPSHVRLDTPPPTLPPSSMGEGGYQRAVETCKQYIGAGDAFQIVPSQRFELTSPADPFDIYRALRVVNPSPYLFYLQVEGAILVGSSPEILCNVTDGVATSRPLAGTRKRGKNAAEDDALAAALQADPKDRAEHIMLVDLHRNDIGRIATPGSVELPALLAVEKYSHVMHLSSTVTGRLRDGLSAWDALRVSLPVGTVSGAPKVRAMQIIDELEPTRRGPYAGAVGHADFAGNLDMCIALRTMVILPDGDDWKVHIQVGAGIVADSDPDAEHEETVNKAAALAKAVEVAEWLFLSSH